jgi:hypothetical protein
VFDDSTRVGLQVIEWLGMLLDSRFSELVMLDDSHPVIQRVTTLVKDQVRMTQELGRFDAYLSDYETTLKRWKKALKSKAASKGSSVITNTNYTAEILYL